MIWQRYRLLVIFGALFVVGLFVRYGLGEGSVLWSFWSAVDVSFAVALGVLAFMAYREMIRDEDEVRLWFDVEGRRVDTGLCLLRRDCTRSEVIGVLGMMQKRSESRFRYGPEHLHDLLERLNAVRRGEATALYIPLSREEYEQFKLSEEKR
jgi:hypothetical protein